MTDPSAARVVWAAATTAMFVLAGCTDADEHPLHTCPDGKVIDPATIPQHHEPGFNLTKLCVPPTPPAVRLDSVDPTVAAYGYLTVSWMVLNNSLPNGHSMLTEIRAGDKPVAPSALAGPESFGKQLLKREHQNLPVSYTGQVQFTKAGTMYVRAYAEIAGKDYWSDERAVTVTPVKATSVVHELAHTPGGFLGELEPTQLTLQLGDGVAVRNDDVVAHTFKIEPAVVEPFEVAGGAVSAAVHFLAPGTYRITTDDVQPLSAELSVQAPPPPTS